VQTHAGFAVCGVQLNDDLIRQAADSRRNTTGSGQINLSVRSHFAGFDDGYVIFTGASTGESCDGVMSRAKAIRYRAPYTTNSDFRSGLQLLLPKYD